MFLMYICVKIFQTFIHINPLCPFLLAWCMVLCMQTFFVCICHYLIPHWLLCRWQTTCSKEWLTSYFPGIFCQHDCTQPDMKIMRYINH